jgi:hypothetical protein
MVAGRSLPVAVNGAAATGSLSCERERERGEEGKKEERRKKGLHSSLNT